MTRRRYRCSTVRDMLPLHVGGDLDPGHVEGVDDHLHACLSCFREFRVLATMRGRLGVLAEEPLPAGALDGFAEEVMARIAIGEPGPAAAAPGRLRRGSVWPRLAAAAVVVVAVGLGLRIGLGEPGGPVAGGRPDLVAGHTSPAPGTAASRPAAPRAEPVGWPAPALRSTGGQPVNFGTRVPGALGAGTLAAEPSGPPSIWVQESATLMPQVERAVLNARGLPEGVRIILRTLGGEAGAPVPHALLLEQQRK